MIFCSNADLAAIADGMMDCTLPKVRWTHAAHFAAALWLLDRRTDLDAARELPGLIRQYNEATGVENTDTGGYHETITQASLRAARSYLASHRDKELWQIANALLASPLGRSDWLFAYWTRERLFSVEARRRWVEPDLQDLPF
jgi:hypothetical protein